MKDSDIKEYFEREYNKDKNLKAVLSQIRKESNMGRNKLMKMVAMFVLVIGITAGIGYASTVVYEKVFKEPKKYETLKELEEDMILQQKSQEVLQEDKEKSVDMSEALNEANRFLNELGYSNQEFVNKELKKNYVEGAELVYYFTTNTNLTKGIHVAINAENGKCVSFTNNNLKDESVNTDQLSVEEATKKADELFKLFKLKEKYKLKYIKEIPSYFREKKVDLWRAVYYKDYDGALSQYENVEMMFATENGELKLESMWIGNDGFEFENNPIVITKEKAKEIALEKDKELTDNEIDNISINLEVKGMNAWIYELEQNGGKYTDVLEVRGDGTVEAYDRYRMTENIARKVWNVTIYYKEGEFDINNMHKYDPKSIFVDATTGEIIGGENAYFANMNP